ncbi:cation transporter [Rivihabitans pingtungensis]|uniref:cation transporter n=1 Tax=Rivihabitans pingtungensis TaxID=1054498 RepID=UPI0023EFECD5|nr:cation transporter [Rivihabitans pingtungensis]
MTPPILTLPIAGMTCAACAVRLEKVLKRLPDVDAEVNFATASARLTSRTAQPPDLAAAMAAVARAGFQVPLSRQRLTLEGMTCAACAQRIEKVLNRLPGVHASVNFATASAEVDYPAGVVSSAQLLDAVRRAGYQAQLPRADTPVTSAGEQDHTGRWLLASTLLALPFVAEMLAMLAGRHGLLPVAWQWALATPVQFLVGWRFYRGAWLSLRGGGANMDVLVALGTSMAYLLSVWTALTAPHHGHVYFEASVSVITLVLLGKWLEQRARRQTAGAIEALLKLAPTTARVERDGAVLDVPVAGSLGWLFVLSLLFITVALSLGLLISTIVDTQVAAMLASGMALIMPVVLLSGMIYPVENMALPLQWFSNIIPAKWYIVGVKKLMIEGLTVGSVVKEMALLSLMAAALITISLKKFKKRLE